MVVTVHEQPSAYGLGYVRLLLRSNYSSIITHLCTYVMLIDKYNHSLAS